MAKGHLSEDTIKFIMTAESSELQQEIHKSGKVIDELKKKEADLRKEQAAVKSVLGEESKEYRDLSVKIKKVTKDIADENLKLTEMHKQLGTSSMTMAQLRKEAKNLQRQLDNTSQALNPEEYEAYARKLQEVNQRMSELRLTAKGLSAEKGPKGFLKNIIGTELDLKGLKTFLAGNALTKLGAVALEFAGRAADRIKELVSNSIEAARAAQGITHAFEQLNQPGILDNLRKATHGTVSDLELMKAAVQARDFRLPLDQLGKYLEFAQLKAQQTGQSVDYMTNSIVTGLGRKSVMILDNLGISAAQIREEMAKGGDMAQAVGRIIDQQLSEQGEHFVTAAEREEQATTAVSNAQLNLGNQMQKTFGIGETSFKEMQAKAEVFVLNGLTKLIVYCQDLYDRLASVRGAVETVKVAFDTVFKVCEIGFLWIIDTVKGVGRLFRDLGALIESVFTFDWDNVKTAANNLMIGLGKTITEFLDDGEDVGSRWGKNVLDSINKAMKGRKIETPKPANELDEVTVTGQKRDRAFWEEQLEQRKKVYEATKKGSKEAAAALKELKEAEREVAKYNTYKKDTKDRSTENRREDKDNLKIQKEARQKALDQERYFYEASVRAYRQQLADKEISQEQFNTMQLSLATVHNDRILAKEKEQLETIRQMTFKDKKQREAAILEQQRNVEKAENDTYNARTAAYQDFQRNMEQLKTGGMNSTEREEYNYQLQLKALEGYYKASLQYAQEHNQELLSIDIAYQKAREKLETDHQLRLEQLKQRIRGSYGLTTLGQQLEAGKQQLERDLQEKLLTQEEYQQAVANLEQSFEERKLQARRQYGIVSQQELYNQQLEQLRLAKEQELLTEEEYEKAKGQLKMQQWKEQYDYYSSLFSDAFSALQQAELEMVDAKYAGEIEAARRAGKDTTDLENKAADEKLKIQKKYADVNFAIQAAQIITNTATAVMKAFSDLGPIAGAIAGAMISITGTAQLLVANAQRQKVKNMTLNGSSGSTASTGVRVASGREEGGFLDVEREQDGRRFHAKYDPRRRGFVDRPTVIVGEGPAGQSKEWVASNAAVENPTVRPVIDAIDQAQRTGNIRTLDLRKLLLRQQGLASGGFLSASVPAAGSASVPAASVPGVSASVPGVSAPVPGVSATVPGGSATVPDGSSSGITDRLATVLERIERNGINAIVGIDDMDARQQLRDRARNIGAKGE